MSTEAQAAVDEILDKRKRVHGTIKPRFIHALAPLMRQVDEMAQSDFFFMNQVNTQLFGNYLIPAEKGVILTVVDSYRMLAVYDPEGDVSEPIKVHFPDAMLDALAPKIIKLSDQDGGWFEVEAEPKAHIVFLTDICGIACLEKEDEKKWKGCLGSWMNNDIRNHIDLSSYRAEPANVNFIRGAINAIKDSRASCSNFQVNPHLLAPICEAGDRLGVRFDLSMAAEGSAVAIRSIGDVEMFGMIMPTEYTKIETESPIYSALL